MTISGNLVSDGMGIRSCNWGSDCGATATNVYWGNPNGPVSPSGNPMACGAVTYSPWYVDSSDTTTASSDVFSGFLANCDGSQTPDQALNAAQTDMQTASSNYSMTIAGQQIDCGNGYQDVCAEITRERTCYSAAQSVAWSNVSIAGVPAQTPDTGSASDVIGAWLSTAANSLLKRIGDAIPFVGEIYSAIGLYHSLTNAANTCLHA
jgi:hypothetical protein